MADTLRTITDTIKSQQTQITDQGKEIREVKQIQQAQLGLIQQILKQLSGSKPTTNPDPNNALN